MPDYKIYTLEEIKESLSKPLEARLDLVDEIFEFTKIVMTDEAKEAQEYLRNNRSKPSSNHYSEGKY